MSLYTDSFLIKLIRLLDWVSVELYVSRILCFPPNLLSILEEALPQGANPLFQSPRQIDHKPTATPQELLCCAVCVAKDAKDRTTRANPSSGLVGAVLCLNCEGGGIQRRHHRHDLLATMRP